MSVLTKYDPRRTGRGGATPWTPEVAEANAADMAWLTWLDGVEWDLQEQAWARDDLISFVRRLQPNYRPAWFHFEIAAALKDVADGLCDRLLIIMPPRHGKSTLASRYFPAWFLGRRPDERIIAVSYSARLAERFSRFSRNVLRQSGYPFDVSPASDSAAADIWDLEGRQGGYVSAGVGGSITGEGADVLLIDDSVKSAKEADSPAIRESTIDWYQNTAYPRLQSRGAVVVIGTRWRDDDLIGWLLDQQAKGGDRWRVLHYPAINRAGEALWPEMYDLPKLLRRKAVMTGRMWNAQYMGSPVPDEGGVFKQWWWKFWHKPGQPLPPVKLKGPGGTDVFRPCQELPTFFDEQLQSWDFAVKDGSAGSFVVGQTWGLRGSGRWLLDQYRAQVDFVGSVAAIQTQSAIHPKARRKLIEAKANGPAVMSALKGRLGGMVAVDPGKVDKEARARAVTVYVEAGDVWLPHPAIAPWVWDLIAEAATFPLGANDDQVDAMSQALANAERAAGSRSRVSSYAGDEPGRWGDGDDD